MQTNIERYEMWASQLLLIDDISKREAFEKVVNKRLQQGCVVRALETALGVEATDEEWDLRIAAIEKISKDFKEVDVLLLQINNPEFEYKWKLTKRALDKKSIMEYVEVVSKHDTPLGEALRRHRIKDTVLDGRSIYEMAAKGQIVLVDIPRDKGRHLVNVGLTDEGTVSLNDDGEIIDFGEYTYRAFILTPLPEHILTPTVK